MAEYIVNLTDPLSPPITILPRGLNGPGSQAADTTLKLYGDGQVNWGEAVNENFVRLLENFTGATAPVNPVMGQLWVETQLYYHDTVASAFYVYDTDPASLTHQDWVSITAVESLTAPTETIGTYWFDLNTNELKYFSSAYDGVPASWMVRSHASGSGVPTSPPQYQVKMYDANVAGGAWGNISTVLISDDTTAPGDGRVGTLRFSPTGETLHVWSGLAWSALVSADSPVFTGDIDMGGNSILNLADAVGPTDALNVQTGDARYVNVSGDTMVGDLTLAGDPTAALHAAPKQYVESWAAPAVHAHVVADITDAGTAAGVDVGLLPGDVPINSYITGKQTIWVPAGAILPRVSNGAGSATTEMSTNKVSFKTLNFDTASEEFAQFFVQMPASWDEGSVTAKMVWSHPATTISFGVVWGIRATAFSDGDALDTAFGVEQTVADVGGTTNVLYSSPETPPITVAGTPVANDVVAFQVSRKVSDGADLMAVDARLHGVVVYYNTDALNDA